jgi:hypothetical protein
MSPTPASTDEVYGVFTGEYAGDSLGPMSLTRVARNVAAVRYLATMTPDESKAWRGEIPEDLLPDVAEALERLVTDGRLATVLGRSVRRTWPGSYKPSKPYPRDEPYYARTETVEKWAARAQWEEEHQAKEKAATSRLEAALQAAQVRATVSKRGGSIVLKLPTVHIDGLARLLELGLEQERQHGRRRP